MEAILSAFGNLLSLEVLLCMVTGVLIGVVIGALPGLTPPLAIALLIPLTYGLDPVPALVMMVSLYTAGIYGGSISAILLHTPGTPSAAATADDGFALTRQGKGLTALGVSTLSSMAGGFISGIALLIIAPFLARFSLRFGPPEYFFLSLFGITIIGSLSSGKMLKGLLCGAFGLFLATVGVHLSSGYSRFIYGILYLQNGIPMAGTMVGLFSISQVMIMAEEMRGKYDKGLAAAADDALRGKLLPSFKETIGLIPTMIRSSIIGVLVGILPGAGADIGAWVSYNEAKRWSKHKEEFGNGSIEGVCAPEAANNAVTGGALIPLMTLGIPGSTTAAILLGGLMIHGLVPGSQLFTRYADTTYAIILGFIIANIVMGLVGFTIARSVSKIAGISVSILAPVVVVLAVIGCYSMNLRMMDVFLMAIFGFMGYFMRKADVPTAPMVLALILGGNIESNLYQSTMISKGEPLMLFFLSRPICVVFMVMIAAAFLVPIVTALRERGKK